MHTTLLRFLPLVALLATGCVIEVDDENEDWSGGGWGGSTGKAGTAGVGGKGGSGGSTGGTGGAAGTGGAGGGVDEVAFVRFAHLAPNTEAVDICLRPADFADSWVHPDIAGPIFANNAVERAVPPGGDPALAPNPKDFYFPGVSTYFEIRPPGPWEVRLVPASNDLSNVSACDRAVEGVADLTLDLRNQQVLTVALSGSNAATDAAAPLPLGWAPYGEPDSDASVARGHVVNTLSGGADVTLATFDPVTEQATPLAKTSAAAGSDTRVELTLEKPARYVMLGAPGEDGVRPLLTAPPAIEVSAKPGDVWTFFAAGTGPDEAAEPLRPQTIACRNLIEGRGVNEVSLIAADCIYLNSSTAAPPPPEPNELERCSPGFKRSGSGEARPLARGGLWRERRAYFSAAGGFDLKPCRGRFLAPLGPPC